MTTRTRALPSKRDGRRPAVDLLARERDLAVTLLGDSLVARADEIATLLRAVDYRLAIDSKSDPGSARSIDHLLEAHLRRLIRVLGDGEVQRVHGETRMRAILERMCAIWAWMSAGGDTDPRIADEHVTSLIGPLPPMKTLRELPSAPGVRLETAEATGEIVIRGAEHIDHRVWPAISAGLQYRRRMQGEPFGSAGRPAGNRDARRERVAAWIAAAPARLTDAEVWARMQKEGMLNTAGSWGGSAGRVYEVRRRRIQGIRHRAEELRQQNNL